MRWLSVRLDRSISEDETATGENLGAAALPDSVHSLTEADTPAISFRGELLASSEFHGAFPSWPVAGKMLNTRKYGCNSISGGVLWGRSSVCAKSCRDSSALTN